MADDSARDQSPRLGLLRPSSPRLAYDSQAPSTQAPTTPLTLPLLGSSVRISFHSSVRPAPPPGTGRTTRPTRPLRPAPTSDGGGHHQQTDERVAQWLSQAQAAGTDDPNRPIFIEPPPFQGSEAAPLLGTDDDDDQDWLERASDHDDGDGYDVDRGTETGAQSHAIKRVGTFSGVTLPTLEFMWSVLIFIRYPKILGEAGLLLSLALILGCVATVALTATSLSAIATNGLPRAGVVPILTRTLGSGIAGSISLIFAVGVAIFSAVEVVGSAEGLVLAGGQLFPESVLAQLNEKIVSVVCLVTLISVASLGHGAVFRLALLFMAALLIAFISLFLGFAFSSSAHVAPGLGWSLAHVQSNLWPSSNFNLTETVSLLFPCFLGIFTGVNNSASLKNPYRSIPRGALSAIGTSALLYCCIFICLASTVPQAVLLSDEQIAPKLGWPLPHLAVGGVFLVGNGSALHCLMLSSSVLSTVFALRVIPRPRWFPPLEWRGGPHGFFHDPFIASAAAGGEPRIALFFVGLLAFPFVFAGDLENLAVIVALCFLLCYTITNLSCLVLERLRLPMWRPVYKRFHWITSSLVPASTNAGGSSTFGGGPGNERGALRVWGHAIHGLLYQMALNHLLSVEAEGMKEIAHLFRYDLQSTETEDIRQHREVGLALHGSDAGRGAGGSGSHSSTSLRRRTAHSSTNRSLSPQRPSTSASFDVTAGMLQRPLAQPAPKPVNSLFKPQIVAFIAMPHGKIKHPSCCRLCRSCQSAGGSGNAWADEAAAVEVRFSRVTQPVRADDDEESENESAAEKRLWEETAEDVRVALGQSKARRRRLILHRAVVKEQLAGFVKVLVAPSVRIGQSILLQTVGLGELTANTVVSAWPERAGGAWPKNLKSLRELAHLWRLAQQTGQNILITRGTSTFPENDAPPMSGTIDVYWIVNEGPLLLLVGYILRQHSVWRGCPMRLFAVSRSGSEDPAQVEAVLKGYLFLFRVPVSSIEVISLAVDETTSAVYGATPSSRYTHGVDFAGALRADMFESDASETAISESEWTMSTGAAASAPARSVDRRSRVLSIVSRLTGRSDPGGAGSAADFSSSVGAPAIPTLETDVPEAIDEAQLPGLTAVVDESVEALMTTAHDWDDTARAVEPMSAPIIPVDPLAPA
ncbi:hypothetical protein BCR44DRAFT_1534300 [Catenaria anguillulae PL171]|uniref:Amino acid permease-domain-containing protein n=1 Tax=Catenaria anguillulae PL171 TaxID=765915 RepID=A0A1Y2HG57_9FUNG|nr:hypothetical protein BCR44DRAFT_1534300 [Catenaria anguillulae PL171]